MVRTTLVLVFLTVAAISAACSLVSGITMDDVVRHDTGINQAAAVLQASIALASLRTYLKLKTGLFVPILAGALVVAHPGLYAAFNRSWFMAGDCGTWMIEMAVLYLFIGLVVLVFQADTARKLMAERKAEGVTRDK